MERGPSIPIPLAESKTSPLIESSTPAIESKPPVPAPRAPLPDLARTGRGTHTDPILLDDDEEAQIKREVKQEAEAFRTSIKRRREASPELIPGSNELGTAILAHLKMSTETTLRLQRELEEMRLERRKRMNTSQEDK